LTEDEASDLKQRHDQILKRDQLWPAVAIVGFLHAGIFVLHVLNGAIPPAGIVFAVAAGGSAIGVWRRRLWAVYVLALAELLLFAGEWVAAGGTAAVVGPLVSLAGAVLLTGSASGLSPAKVTDLPLKRILIAGFVAYFAIAVSGFVFAFVATLVQLKVNPSPLSIDNLESAVDRAVWVVAFAIAAKRAPWSFETALGAAIVAFVILATDQFITSVIAGRLDIPGSIIALCGAGIGLIASGVVGEGLAVALSPFKPKPSPELAQMSSD
jgi:hypothetical protein